MKRSTSVFSMLLALLGLTNIASAENFELFNCTQNPKEKPVTQSLYKGDAEKKFFKDLELKAEEATTPKVQKIRDAKPKSVTTIADLAGEYVMTFYALNPAVADGGLSVSVDVVEGTDSIVINNFWSAGIKVKAKVDITTKKITIPSQTVGTDASVGDYDLALCLTTGRPDRSVELEGEFSDDGTISITSWWGMFINEGEYKDYYFGAYYGTVLEKANGTMTEKMWNTSTSEYITATFNIVAEQTSSNILAIKNFANFGQTVEIELNKDKTATIACQRAYIDVNYGDWYTYATVYNDDMTLKAYGPTITCNQATDNYTISWGNWSLLNDYLFYGAIVESSVTTNFSISYPDYTETTSFQGEGTEASPYLIKSLSDLIYLAESVNTSTDLDYGTTTNPYARVYLGKYFRLEADIDMSDYRFTPIGYNRIYTFAGVFDGNGHTITGLNVNSSARGYAGLFGKCDTLSVIKNLTLVKPVVKTFNAYAGAVAGYSLGTIDNCHVSDAEITNTYSTGTAGIAGQGTTITNCTVTNANIYGEGGFCGGIAGQIDNIVSNCSVTNTYIYAGWTNESTPSGGIAGSLYMADAANCYFSGTVYGDDYYNLYIGGIAGVCLAGNISECYSVGEVSGYGETASVGGIAGALYGNIENCYSNTFVSCEESKYTGGLTGSIYAWSDDGTTMNQSSVKNSYTAGYVVALVDDTYDTTTELRETIGTVASGSPTLENIYYDNQIVNFESAQFGTSTADMTSANGLTGLDANTWVFTEGYYPRLKGMEDTEVAKLSASSIAMEKSNSIDLFLQKTKLNLLGETKAYLKVGDTYVTDGYNSSIKGDSIILKSFGNDTIYFVNEQAGSKHYILKITPIQFEGAGTEEDPYLIQTKDDLATLAEATTNFGQEFADTYFKMTNDIYFADDDTFIGISANGSSSSNQFRGHFDGCGYTIHNMKYKEVFTWKTAPEDSSDGIGTPNTTSVYSYQGFIGTLGEEGTLKNLIIASDCDFTQMWANSGVLVGRNYGVIDNCKNYADIYAYNRYVGGIAGNNSGTVSNCYNAGTVVAGLTYAGGIAGSNVGLITKSANTGDVYVTILSKNSTTYSLMGYVGGIAGHMNGSRIDNCVNSGTITGYSKVGGIAGTLPSFSTSTYKNDLINNINYGSVFASNELEGGAICGTFGTEGTISDNYYDVQISSLKANSSSDPTGMTGVNTSVLTSISGIENFATDTWTFADGAYPVLKQFAEEEAVKIASSIIIKLADDETTSNILTSATLSTANECTWTLKVGTQFTISGNTLTAPTEVSDMVVDTLIANSGSIVKPFIIKSAPVVPLTGEGTIESPYLITNATDWNNLATYIASCKDPLTDKYLKITDDIDFTDIEMSPLGYDRVTGLDADLNGNNKTIKGFNNTSDASYYGGAIVLAESNANIYDLTVEGTVTSSFTYTGGVFGKLSGKVSNVTSKVSVTSDKNYTGGLVGYAVTGATLYNCSNEGAVSSSSSYTGGLVGSSETGVKYEKCYNAGTVTYTGSSAKSYTAGLIATCYPDSVIECYNTGVISASQANSGGLAGVIAFINATSTSSTHYMKDCYNTADISSISDNFGIVYTTTSAATVYMDGCYNTGNITSTSTTAKSSTYTAGIAAQYTPGSIYRNCWNSGTITSTKSNYASGLFGTNSGSGSATKIVKIVNCYNLGEVVAGGNYGAGIVAYIPNHVTIDSCYNKGAITGTTYTGGIVAGTYIMNATNIYITNCWNSGDITVSGNRAGGIVGYNAATLTISNCFNTGDITCTGTTQSSCYGIGGIAGQGGANFTNIYSTGNVKGVARVGGLIGYPVKAKTTISGGYFTGTIDAPADSCGMIIGVNTVANNVWNSSNSVKDVYYLDENLVENKDVTGTSISSAELAKLDLGEGWVAGDDYTYPMLSGLSDIDVAKINAVTVVFEEGDNASRVTKDFYVGAPEGVTWTADNANVSIEGNNVHFTGAIIGTLTLTATCGDYSIEKVLTCDATTGVNAIGDGKVVVNEEFYNVSGAKVAEPENGEKAVYIVVKTYDDGTTATVKEVR